MKLPSLKVVGNESLDTVARIGGATVGKLALSAIKKQGLVFSLTLFVAGLLVTIYGPDKFKLKEMGEGLALYGGLKVINEISQPTINWGLGNATPAAMGNLSLPEPVRKIFSNIPSIDGMGVVIYPAGHPMLPAENARYREVAMNGLPVFDANVGKPKAPNVVNIEGIGNVPVLAA